MKGIILAGGNGSRLWPITAGVSKQLLPVYNKPLIYYPLSTLMLAGICEILVITKPEDRAQFERLLGDGRQFGISISFANQEKPSGIAEAFIIAKEFIGQDPVCLILGDNIFYGAGLDKQLKNIVPINRATIFAYEVNEPERYGVVEFSNSGEVISIEEKPSKPKSNYAIPGLYFYPNSVITVSEHLKPSHRGELEITDVNLHFIGNENLDCIVLPRGTAWFDTGTFESMNDASNYVRAIEQRQGLEIGNPSEIALKLGLISASFLTDSLKTYPKNEYRTYVEKVLKIFLLEKNSEKF
jgi:glucose-1-phosphate thymidylyltransferase